MDTKDLQYTLSELCKLSFQAGFLFGFDIVVISGANLPIRELWNTTPLFHGIAHWFLASYGPADRMAQVRLVVVGPYPPDDTYLYISNHRSFYDPIRFLSQMIANPVSKAEVSRYPLIGWGAQLTEVLMLDRSKRKARGLMKHKIYENLRDGTSILVYPEGTTTANEWSGEFKKGAFESAVKAGKSVIPVAMEYPDESHYWTQQPLYKQFIYQIAGRSDNRIFLSMAEPVWDSDPMELLTKVQRSIDDQITMLRKFRKHQGSGQ